MRPADFLLLYAAVLQLRQPCFLLTHILSQKLKQPIHFLVSTNSNSKILAYTWVAAEIAHEDVLRFKSLEKLLGIVVRMSHKQEIAH